MKRFFCAAIGVVSILPALSWAQVVGRFASAQGSVVVERGGVELRARAGVELSMGDEVRTGATGRAKLLLEDGTVLNLGDDSRLKLTKYILDPTNGRDGLFELVRGTVRAWVTKLRNPKSKFDVQTPTAVAGVRGTDYALREGDAGAQVVVFGGEVIVRSSVEGVAGQCVAQGGMACEVLRGQAPGAAGPASFELQQSIINQTKVSSIMGTDAVRLASLLSARLQSTPGFGSEWRRLYQEQQGRYGEQRSKDASHLPGESPNVRDTILPASTLQLRVIARVAGTRF
jgi:hypothetical protein